MSLTDHQKYFFFPLCASLWRSHQLKHTILLEPTTISCPFNLSANSNKTTNTMCSANYFQVHFEQQTKVPWQPTETRFSNPLALSSLRCIQRVGGTKAHGYFERRCLFDNEVKDEMKHEAGELKKLERRRCSHCRQKWLKFDCFLSSVREPCLNR